MYVQNSDCSSTSVRHPVHSYSGYYGWSARVELGSMSLVCPVVPAVTSWPQAGDAGACGAAAAGRAHLNGDSVVEWQAYRCTVLP